LWLFGLELLLSASSATLSFGFLLEGVELLMMRAALARCSSADELAHLLEDLTRLLDVGPHLLLVLSDEGDVGVMFLLGPVAGVDVRLLGLLERWRRFRRLRLLLKILLQLRQQLILRNRLIKHLRKV
jgi:hypothetical protein